MKKESKITKENAYDGVIVEAVGPVVDVRFEQKHLPEILTALVIPLGEEKSLTVEVMQHIYQDIE